MKIRATFLLVTFASAIAYGQTAQATLTGVVTDASGSVVADAPVRALHVETGTVITGLTSETGNYTIPQLPIGLYQVTVEKPGFKIFRREGLTLSAAQIIRLDVSLEIGSATESVTVTADASLLNTDSGALTHNITPEQIQALPLLPVGTFIRDPFALAQTLPGVNAVAYSMRVNGLPNSSIQYRLDGEVLGQTAAPGITTRTQPSPDAIQEVAVQTSNFTAEYGSVSGALFNVTLKSGTNHYHGTVYDYAVNEVLNADDAAIHGKNRVRRHDYGFNIGGPIHIPWLYNGTNKSFFFFNWEQYRDRQLQVAGFTPPTVPTEAFRNGDFSALWAASGNTNLRVAASGSVPAHDYVDPLGSVIRLGTIYDPRSTVQVPCNPAVSIDCGTAGNLVSVRTPFANNRVPQSLFDPVALAIQNKYIPLPQGPNANAGILINNYFNPFYTTRVTSSPAFRLDHNLSAAARLSFSYTLNKTNSPVQALGGLAEGLPEPITANQGTYESGPTYRMNFDYTVRPTVILHVGAGWSQFDFSNHTITTDYNAEKDIGLKGATLNRNFPRMSATAVTTPAVGGMNAMGATPQGDSPERRPSGTVSLTVIRGNHSIKYGADFRQDMLPTLTYTNTAGTYSFGSGTAGGTGNGVTWQPSLLGLSGFTGNTDVGFGYANFLMGSVRNVTLSVPISYRRSKRQWGMYLQDTWRMRRNLTLDYGVRWDYGSYTKEDYGRVANLSLTTPNPSAGGHLGALAYEATCHCQFAHNYPFAIGPRLGIAYTLNAKTVIRGGAGLAYGSTGTVSGTAQNNATTPAPAEGEQSFFLRDGIPSTVQPQWPVFDPGLGQTPGSVLTSLPAPLVDRNAGRPERVYQWNISVQREITRNLVVEASYVGNRAVWLSAGGLVDFNAISPQDLARYGFTIGNLDDATLLNQRISLLTSAQKATLAARGVNLQPYAGFPITGNTSQTVLQALRPYPQYNAVISPSSAPIGKSWYDSLQINLNKRFSHGLLLNANYTWSKNLQLVSSPDVFNRSLGKDLATVNPPQILRISFEYQVPKPSAVIPVLGNRLISNAIGGWALSSALFYQSGAFIGRPANGAANPISRWLGRGPGFAQLKKNPDGSYMSPWAVNWTDLNGKVHPEPLDINCHCFDPEKTIVFNPNAWQAVPDGQWAAQTSQLPFFHAARRPNEAMNLARNFRFGKERRFALQVRVEFQNIFNRQFLPTPQGPPTLFAPQGLSFINPTYTTSSDGRYTSGFGTFGNLRVAGALGAQRSGQFIARFTF